MLSKAGPSVVEHAPDATLPTRAADARAATRRMAEPAALGQLPLLSLVAAVGLLLVAVANQVSRSGLADGQLLYWAGLVLIVGPILARQCFGAASRVERVALVLVVGIALYLVKVIPSAYAFTFPDEFTQTYNVDALLRTQRLFHPNPLVNITALYPGLPSVGAALSSLTGLSIFQAGIAVAGVARLLLMLGLFLLLEEVSGSAKIAAIGATLYAGNPNFLLYSADFGYETLALPLAVVALFAAARRRGRGAIAPGQWWAWTLVGTVAVLSVVMTHHVTSYALAIALLAVSLLATLVRRRLPESQPAWDLAVFACCAVLGWLLLVASPTLVYLSQVIGPAAVQALAVVRGLSPPRQLFAAGNGPASPEWQKLTAYASVLLIALGLGYGLWRLRRRPLTTPVGVLLAIAAAAYIPVQALRLTPAAWETANRSSEFLFMGAALVLAIAASTLARTPWLSRAIPLCGLVIIIGGIISGSNYVLQIPPPYLVETATGQPVEPQGVADAHWAAAALGPDAVMATDPTNGQLLAAYAAEWTYGGEAHGILGMMRAPYVDDSVRGVLSTMQVQYVVMDRRLSSQDHSSGLFAPGGAGPLAQRTALFDPSIYAKFDAQPGVSRIADSGDIVFYDVRGLY